MLIFIYLMFIQIFIFKIYFLLRNNLINFIPLLTIILISSLVERTYNEYFDPLIFVLIFTFFKFDKNFMIDKKHLIISYGLFYFSFLIFANLYYNYFNLNAV